MLAPPALYIPRHCRGTPFERGRCRRDACMVMYSPNAVSTLIDNRTATASPLLRGVRRSRGVCIVKQIQKVKILKWVLCR
jgi:hypothetical protein